MLHKNPENHPVRAKFRTLKSLKRYQELPKFGKFVTEVLIFRSSRSLMFFTIGALEIFATFTGKHLCWPLHAFFYRTHYGGCSQIFVAANFSAESGIYCGQSHGFLVQTLLKTGVKPQKQPLELFCKKRFSKKFCKFQRKVSVLKSLFNRVAGL